MSIRVNHQRSAYPVSFTGTFEASANDTRKTLMFGSLLAVLQALDGILTSMGVSRWGVDAEGNPILRALMQEFGHIPTLSVVKFIAILLVIALSFYAKRLIWVHKAMGAISCVYIFAAILPWTFKLFIE